ncbi:MAG: stage 0 sporulation protein, partial [candidate division Zixibacteria bacterium]|nr:stage 0 sporulation protein [candidate division Zixibacteria bacterium]
PNILRAAGNDDVDRLRFNRQKEEESFEDCLVRIEEKGLNMKLVDVEYQFDCNKITFYFTAERRVDFRELVKDLAAIYKTRIELRQIGVRDEAKRLGGFGCCGLQQCCSAWLNEFQPISTQLARDQGLSLNPSKISGNCGRLLCCLLYEQPVYEDMASQFPRVGSKCEGCQGNAVVTQVNYFKGFVMARYEDNYEEKIPLREYRKTARLRRRGQLPDKPKHREDNNSNNNDN